MANEKKALRAAIMAQLEALGADKRARLSAAITARFLASPEFRAARTVMAYDSAGAEVDTHAIQCACLEQGKTLCLPRTQRRDRSITARAVLDPQHDLLPSRFQFREPAASLPVVPVEQLDLVIVPGIAFDAQGRRLGRGAGYYDRFLATMGSQASLCALAFNPQLVEAVPAEAHDVPVQLIFTETRVIRCCCTEDR